MRPRLWLLAAAATLTTACSSDDDYADWPPHDTVPAPTGDRQVRIDIAAAAETPQTHIPDEALTAEFFDLFDLGAPADELAAATATPVTISGLDPSQLVADEWSLQVYFAADVEPQSCSDPDVPCALVGWNAQFGDIAVAADYAELVGPPGARQLTAASMCQLIEVARGTCQIATSS